MTTKPSHDDVTLYYDSHVSAKIRDFVDGNRRISAAWVTIEGWAPARPRRIVELGCGVGSVSWRMAMRWAGADVIGVDLSPASIACAKQLFKAPNLRFSIDESEGFSDRNDVDLIVLMDVYEHVPYEDRNALHEKIRRALDPSGRVVLTFPTADYLRWVRETSPELLQPVDEAVDANAMLTLAGSCNKQLLLFQEVNVWKEGDFAHAAIGSRTVGCPVHESSPSFDSRRSKLLEVLLGTKRELSRDDRLAMVTKALGPTAYQPLGSQD